ncbi:TadE/TadG family type IV pilus assembly protein [Jannaschia ovalis]|uniref:TadE/TadG family type IV pilus assembly protein n=1 Tax=Jannaschia ovalis TaxID=3038773 RepID=A0ABY8LD93_9RHOB|nr:TadE/TadG family type IV pilus assembly protein [Jannaschia sp. GRR-S6-38]WGH79287.1 TadE/TadG family type IV pilus assembly protein [Jannaschia sp. GRR-S6-38]
MTGVAHAHIGGAALHAARLSTRVMDLVDRLLGFEADEAGAPDRESGGITVEFTILLPVFLAIFMASFEASMLLTRQVMLERGVDMATRDIRLDGASGLSQIEMRDEICARARILPDCANNLLIELTEIDQDTYDLPTTDTPCVDRSDADDETANWIGSRADKMILMRACFSVNPIMPGVGLGADLVNDIDGTIRMVTATAFIVEPA